MTEGSELRWGMLSQAEGLVVHAPDGGILDVNRVAEHLLGVPRDQMLGSRPDEHLWDRLETLDGDVLAPALRPAALALSTGEAVEDQLLVVHRAPGDRRVLRVQARIHPAGVSAGGCVVSFIDVTSEVAAGDHARRQAQRIASAVGAFVFAAAAGPGGMQFIHVSPGSTDLLGDPVVGEGVGAAAARVLAPGQERRLEQMCEEMGAGAPGGASLALAGADGRWIRVRWVPRADGEAATVDGIVLESTGTRAQERELAGLHSLVEMTSDLVALSDLQSRLIYLNQAARELLGLGAGEDASALAVPDLFAAETRSRWASEELPAVLARGAWHGDGRLQVPGTGETISVHGSTYLLHDPLTGQPMGIALVRRDVSEVQRVADEQRAITEIATAIAEGADEEPLLGAVARSARRATGAAAVALVRASGSSRALVAGAGDDAAVADLVADEHRGRRATVAVHGREWGWLAAEPTPQARVAPAAVDESLQRFAHLAATALLTSQTRRRLLRQASTDFVTGLANHRAFQQRLLEENSHAQRSGEAFALIVFDLDGFKAVNDEHGHPLGDEVLRDLGQVLRMESRGHDVPARIGGDEFALLLPGADAQGAAAVAIRCRDSFAASAQARGLAVSLSAGIADRTHAQAPEDLLRLADGALYWAKSHGSGVVVYDEGVVRELSARERAESLERGQVLSALRVLARVTDLRDPSTHQHSARVAALAQRLAAAAGWPQDRQALLHEAGLVHDVGKLVVADAILRKPGRLTPEEYEEVKRHAALGADIAAGALSEEQVRWIREHHERPDGAGYPDGLREDAISDGGQLLAVADTWDVMTSGRTYQARVNGADALAELRALIGAQFTAWAVQMLAQCWEAGESVFE